jgi:hypothetical protein
VVTTASDGGIVVLDAAADRGAPGTMGHVDKQVVPNLAVASVDADGSYSITFRSPAWTFAGTLGAPATQISKASGSDAVGPYHEVTFAFTDTSAKTGGIRVYDAVPAAVLTETFVAATANPTLPFPTFATYPTLAHQASYIDIDFSPVSFGPLTADSPAVFFDDQAHAFILSAASDFMNAATAVATTGLSSGIDPSVTNLPQGFSHQTLLVAEPSINSAYATWGGVLTGRSGKRRVANDATPYLERFGYWTDHYAYYYYQYDTATGYPATLTSVRDYFDKLGMPLAYMQLDSWWYPKGADQEWNDKAGGQYEYVADPTVFPEGLPSFRSSLALPFITHARWIDPDSPYRAKYTMSNNVSTDRAYWDMIASYVAAGGVAVYEQDWLNQMALPLTNNLTDQEAFMDNMASAMAAKGLDMQYCMPLPRHYLQGSKYPNLTTTRVSADGFGSTRYKDFLFVSLLTSSLGAWPWVDTFYSTETDNLLLATLSAGMVGVGDAIGTASLPNLLQSARPDGVIVKPDVPIVPLDETFVNLANGVDKPLVAATYTDFGGVRASYVYAFNTGPNVSASFTPASLGYDGQVFVWNYFKGAGKLVDASAAFTEDLRDGASYYVVVPIGPSGIAFAGDLGKFVSLGKKRIASVSDDGAVKVSLLFAKTERSVTLHGYAPKKPAATASVGKVGTLEWSASTNTFTLPVLPDDGAATIAIH